LQGEKVVVCKDVLDFLGELRVFDENHALKTTSLTELVKEY